MDERMARAVAQVMSGKEIDKAARNCKVKVREIRKHIKLSDGIPEKSDITLLRTMVLRHSFKDAAKAIERYRGEL